MHEQVNYTVRWDQSYTLARSCFKARKTSRFLKDLNSAKSSGKHNAFFRHSAIKLELPFLESLRLALSSAELLELRVKMGLQIEAFLGWSPPPSLEILMCAGFFGCLFPARASLVGGLETSPSSVSSEPLLPWPHFLFLFVASACDACIATRVGGWGVIATAGEEPSAWAVSRASKSGVFSSKPISAEVWVGDVWTPWPLCLMEWAVLKNKGVWQLKEWEDGHLESLLEDVLTIESPVWLCQLRLRGDSWL